ncbi:polysaccharide deacetylase family protein [Vibrio algarum]|uniref:WalW protein n=1 Tax=Vibrio algarum TaxID=3020714 RepID=A0ABT4YQB7_9VIBR|nr:hypothetical protein [Vibrio sp. KJ40-1]MDB1123708.1 hypothetical protein [Vibrio sp. KJ40-1]
MDYPFVTSTAGKNVVERYKPLENKNIEFATHLHPWVSPPFEDDSDHVESLYSYPGNLSKNWEQRKLERLTETIEQVTGTRPISYLAGRYGIGKHSAEILCGLGYKIDLSISPYVDFSHQQGPDFSCYSNKSFQKDNLVYLPHTCSILSALPPVTNYLNRNPVKFTELQSNRVVSLVGKFFRIRRYRLSPEGFTFKQMKMVTESQIGIGQHEFILSFHSPSAKPGLTPYVRNQTDLKNFRKNITQYINWFTTVENGISLLPKEIMRDIV